MHPALTYLSPSQTDLLSTWLTTFTVVRDHSWGLVDLRVIEVTDADRRRFMVKAAPAGDSHIRREIAAHRQWLAPWVTLGKAPRLEYADETASILVAEYLPGVLVEGTAAELEPDVHRQAGQLLAMLHAQTSTLDDGAFEADQKDNTLAWLGKAAGMPQGLSSAVAAEVESWPTPPSRVVPTHGDWHPRNWLTHQGQVSAIDFGRAAIRPAHTDLARLAMRQFSVDERLEAAFIEGYGDDPRHDADAWRRTLIREAVGAAGWAHQVGDPDFEQLGIDILSELMHGA